MSNQRYCRACDLLRQMMSHVEDVQSYMDAIAPSELATDEEQSRRLEVCMECEQRLEDGTCFACGCYLAFRTLGASSHCPKNKW